MSSCSGRLLLHLRFGLGGCFDTRLLSIGDGCFSVLQGLFFMDIYLPYCIPCTVVVHHSSIVDFVCVILISCICSVTERPSE